MTFKEIQEIIKMVSKAELTEFKMKDDGFELSIKTKTYEKNGGTPVVAAQPVVTMTTPAAPVLQAAPPVVTEAAKAEAQPAAASPADDGTAATNLVEVKSPIIGTFYRSPSPDKPAFINVGDTIKKGDVVCIVEAMKLFNEIESEVSGKIVKVLVEDAQPVEYDTPLFLVDPAG